MYNEQIIAIVISSAVIAAIAAIIIISFSLLTRKTHFKGYINPDLFEIDKSAIRYDVMTKDKLLKLYEEEKDEEQLIKIKKELKSRNYDV